MYYRRIKYNPYTRLCYFSEISIYLYLFKSKLAPPSERMNGHWFIFLSFFTFFISKSRNLLGYSLAISANQIYLIHLFDFVRSKSTYSSISSPNQFPFHIHDNIGANTRRPLLFCRYRIIFDCVVLFVCVVYLCGARAPPLSLPRTR